jgi:hypothetical protein
MKYEVRKSRAPDDTHLPVLTVFPLDGNKYTNNVSRSVVDKYIAIFERKKLIFPISQFKNFGLQIPGSGSET